jgi:hypothetical protein
VGEIYACPSGKILVIFLVFHGNMKNNTEGKIENALQIQGVS